MRMKKFFAVCCMALIVFGVSGCGSDVPPAANTKINKLYGADLNLTQEEFVVAYNCALDEIGGKDGKNYDACKLDLNNPKQFRRADTTQPQFYSGKERCAVILIKNEANPSQLCGATIVPKPGKEFKLSDLTAEMSSAIFASTRGLLKTSKADADNLNKAMVKFIISALKTPDKSKATSIGGLVIYYQTIGTNFLEIIAEDAPNEIPPDGERMVDSIKNQAKKNNFWQE